MNIKKTEEIKDGKKVIAEIVDGDQIYYNDIEHVRCEECDEILEASEAIRRGSHCWHKQCDETAQENFNYYVSTILKAR